MRLDDLVSKLQTHSIKKQSILKEEEKDSRFVWKRLNETDCSE